MVNRYLPKIASEVPKARIGQWELVTSPRVFAGRRDAGSQTHNC